MIPGIQGKIFFGQEIGGQRRSGFGECGHVTLEFREHGLAENRPAHLIGKMVQEICADAVVRRVFHQVMMQQQFIRG